MGQPLAEPATAAGGALFQRRQPRQLGPGSLSSARAGRQARQPRVSQGPGRLPERAPQAKTHSHHHRLQQALDHAPAVRHRRQAPQAALPHLGQPRPQFGGAGRPPVLQSDEFPAKFPGGLPHRRDLSGQARLLPASRRPQSRQEQQCPQARHRGARGGLRQPQASAEV